jgi:YedE family putative selenium metabolism protein
MPADEPPILRREGVGGRTLAIGLAAAAVTGGLAAWLVLRGNPGNMGICGACFLRDLSGALGLSEKAPAIFRPELAGVLLGAYLWSLARDRFTARSGSHAAARFVLGIAMGVGALVFLGCPFRMFQRLGGGDGTALVGLAGFLAGVGAAVLLEGRGYSVGKTSPAPAPLGRLGPAIALGLVALFVFGWLKGPRAGSAGGPAHAPWRWAIGIGLVAGALLSATGFCGVAAARGIFQRRWAMPLGALALIAGYGAMLAANGKWNGGFEGQPVAHGDHLASFLAMALVGLCGAFAGGCPVRQVVMAGEGNGDAFVTAAGIAAGGALAHNFGLVSAAAGPGGPGGATESGFRAVVGGILLVLAYAWSVARAARASAPA